MQKLFRKLSRVYAMMRVLLLSINPSGCLLQVLIMKELSAGVFRETSLHWMNSLNIETGFPGPVSTWSVQFPSLNDVQALRS